MSVISDYYRLFSDEVHCEENAEFVSSAIHFILERLVDHWSSEKPEGCLDLSDMPERCLGYQPVDVYLPKLKQKSKTYVAEFVGLLSGDRNYVMLDDDARAEIKDMIPYGDMLNSGELRDRCKDNAWTLFTPKTPYQFYAIDAARGGGGGIPILCHPDLGEMYYIPFSYGWKKDNPIPYVCLSKDDFDKVGFEAIPIVAVNWITGNEYVIGCPVSYDYGNETMYKKVYSDVDFKICQPWQVETFRAHVERYAESTRVLRAKAITHTPYFRAEEFGVIHRREFERTAKTLMSEEAAFDKDNVPRISRPLEHRRGMLRITILDVIFNDFATAIHPGFLENLYDLAPGTLRKPTALIADFGSGVKYDNRMQAYRNALRYLGNLFQSLLQTTAINDWFLATVLNSMTGSGKPLAEVSPESTSIPKWLGLTKPEYKALMAEPDEAKLVFLLYLRQKNEVSLKEFEGIYEKVLTIHGSVEKYCRSHSAASGYGIWSLRKKQVSLRGKRNKILLRTSNLPDEIHFYSKAPGLAAAFSPHQYMKYVQQEIDAFTVASTSWSSPLDSFEKMLADYNRMAHEVLPKMQYVLPHNLQKSHDTMVENYNRIMADRKAMETIGPDEYRRFAACYAGKRCDVYADEKFVVLAPTSSLDLYDEGMNLNHCVGSYGAEILSAGGGMLIFFMRPKADPEHSLITIQVNRNPDGSFSLFEIAGKGNRPATDEEMAFFEKWLSAFNAEIAERKKHPKAPVMDYDAEIINLLSVAGVRREGMPRFNAAESASMNYRVLFDASSEIILALLDAGKEIPGAEELSKHIAILCGRHALSKECCEPILSALAKAA